MFSLALFQCVTIHFCIVTLAYIKVLLKQTGWPPDVSNMLIKHKNKDVTFGSLALAGNVNATISNETCVYRG